MGSYAPTLITSFGYSGLQSNAMVSIGYWGLLFCNLLWGWTWYVSLISLVFLVDMTADGIISSDRLGVRGPMVLLGFILGLGFNVRIGVLPRTINYSNAFYRLETRSPSPPTARRPSLPS